MVVRGERRANKKTLDKCEQVGVDQVSVGDGQAMRRPGSELGVLCLKSLKDLAPVVGNGADVIILIH